MVMSGCNAGVRESHPVCLQQFRTAFQFCILSETTLFATWEFLILTLLLLKVSSGDDLHWSDWEVWRVGGGQTEPLLSPHFNGLMEQMSPHDPLSCIMQQFHSDCSSGRLISIIFSLWAGQMAYLGSSQPDPGMFRASSGGPGGGRREIFEILC